MNGMIRSAFQYHEYSSYDPKKMSPHGLDWSNQPNLYKRYPGIEPIQLPPERIPGMGKLSAILKDGGAHKIGLGPFRLTDISRLLRLTNALTAESRFPGGNFYYRSAASAGALYPTEIYIATRDVKDLDDGLYHYAIDWHGLIPIRRGDISNYFMKHIPHSGDNAPFAIIFLTAIFFRSAWKYHDRSYRYHLLDTGHVLENATLSFKALRIPFILSYDFDDEWMNHLLGLDESKEVTLAVAYIPGNNAIDKVPAPKIGNLSEVFRKASITARNETSYSAVLQIHQASAITVSHKTPGPKMTHELGLAPKTWEKIPATVHWPEILDYPDAVFQRRSHRNYVNKPITNSSLMALLNSLCEGDGSCYGKRVMDYETIGIGVIVGHVERVPAGLYILKTADRLFGMVRSGSFIDSMAHICLGQSWLANAAVHILFLANVDLLDQLWGPRGYRYAMMTAGQLGERLYVAATAMGLGCCGIGAFYDMSAAGLLGLNNRSRLLYLLATGSL
jgi:SagB-type dehydrogenase family enzyme